MNIINFRNVPKTETSPSESVTVLKVGIQPEEILKFSEDECILCSQCRKIITHKKYQIDIDGKFFHTFQNPSGLYFEIGCYSEAPGCTDLGKPVLDFTWFSGYAWNVVICTDCSEHLGWFYQKSESYFYGLILNKLLNV